MLTNYAAVTGDLASDLALSAAGGDDSPLALANYATAEVVDSTLIGSADGATSQEAEAPFGDAIAIGTDSSPLEPEPLLQALST